MLRFTATSFLILVVVPASFAAENSTTSCSTTSQYLATCLDEKILPSFEDESLVQEDACTDELEAAKACPLEEGDLEKLNPDDDFEPCIFCPAGICVIPYAEYTICITTNFAKCAFPLFICTDAAADDIMDPDLSCEEYQRKGCAREICTRIVEGCEPCYGHLLDYNKCAEEHVLLKCDPPTEDTCDLPPDTATQSHGRWWLSSVVLATIVPFID